MMSSSVIVKESNMFFDIFTNRRKLEEERKERQIQRIRNNTLNKADAAAQSTDKLIKLLDDETLGVTGSLFYATGGDKRMKR